jgi:hypothetical protein
MSCEDYSESIAEVVEGTLDPARQRALERHAETCEACRSLLADLKSIQAAAFTLDRVELPPQLWFAIEDRMLNEPLPRRGRLIPWPPTRAAALWAAAAVLILATMAGLYPLLRQTTPHAGETATASDPATSDVQSVQAELQAAEEHYNKAIQGLEQIARSDTGELDPEVAAVLLKNLQVIDQAIGESRQALKTQPGSADAQESLFEAMGSKVALLQQTVELINEMRKGNQAEAGRLIKGLNQ